MAEPTNLLTADMLRAAAQAQQPTQRSPYVTLRFTAGRLLWGRVREAVRLVNFIEVGYVQLYESRGWIDREFVAKGDPESIALLKKEIDGLISENSHAR